MHGRKPKPTAMKVLAGNPGKRALNVNEPQPTVPEAVPYAPRHLNAEAKQEWRRVCALLLEAGLFSEVDRAALAMYCQAWGRWVRAERHLQREGEIIETDEGGLYQNPWLHVANRAWEQMRKVLTEFGMTPSSRSRIHVAPGREPSLAEMLFQMTEVQSDSD